MTTTYQPGDHVKVLYLSTRGTTLAPTTVVAVEPRPGTYDRLAVVAPADAVTAENGVLNTTAHPDHVLPYDPTTDRLKRAMDLGYHVGLARRNRRRESSTATIFQAATEHIFTAPIEEQSRLVTAFMTEYDRVLTA